LNALAKINSAKSYLEIGVDDGGTFFNVDVEKKTAVDPVFKFNPEDHAAHGINYYEMTSDAFFAQISDPSDRYDLIYLDGLHTFDQTLRDFCTTLSLSHSKTIWLIDDTHPHSIASAASTIKKSKLYRRLFRDSNRAWYGDVYKAICAIHDFFPLFKYATYTGHGQTVVWQERREDFEPTWNSMGKISRIGYSEFSSTKQRHLNIESENDILKKLRERFH
jgi:hypothetical protein